LFLAISLLYSFVKSPETQSNVAILDPGVQGPLINLITARTLIDVSEVLVSTLNLPDT
jgi:LPS O-antigen subunit length determinant protein (WzzB/FepE family)